MSRAPYVLYGVKYIDLVSLGANASGAHLDLSRAPYVLYGVKCIDLVSLAPNDGQCQPHLALNHSPYNLYDVKYIDLVSPAPYVLYGVKCIDLVSLAPNDGQCQPHLALNPSPYNLYDVKYIDLVSPAPVSGRALQRLFIHVQYRHRPEALATQGQEAQHVRKHVHQGETPAGKLPPLGRITLPVVTPPLIFYAICMRNHRIITWHVVRKHVHQGETPAGGASIPNYIAPLFFNMAQNLDLRCVLVPAPWVLGPKHVSNPE